VFFDLSIWKILVLGVIALVIFGPDQLPKMAAQAGRALRELRQMADGATRDIREGLGPEFSDFDMRDLHPANFVRKHLFDDLDGDYNAAPPGWRNPTASTWPTGGPPPRWPVRKPRPSTPRPPDPSAPRPGARPHDCFSQPGLLSFRWQFRGPDRLRCTASCQYGHASSVPACRRSYESHWPLRPTFTADGAPNPTKHPGKGHPLR